MTPDPLIALLQTETAMSAPPEALAFADSLMKPGALCVLFYGSGLWKGIGEDTLLDFYVLCDDLRAYGLAPLSAVACHLLPPNVYYREHPQGERTFRAKIAVMRFDDFRDGARGKGLTPHIWARFCQPCRLLSVRDDSARSEVTAALADAVRTFERRTRPLLPADASDRAFWATGFRAAFGQELRSEDPTRAEVIFDANAAAFTARRDMLRLSPHAAMPSRPPKAIGKLLHLLRLMKASFTFAGGLDYVLWKIERHSGVRVEASAFQRRHPLLGGWPLLWRLYRAGGFR